MNFVFPKNYSFKPKLLGFIDYSTAILDSIIGIILFLIINIFIKSLSAKISVFITLFLPIVLVSIIGLNKESFITVFKYMYKFIKNQNVYLYDKRSRSKSIK